MSTFEQTRPSEVFGALWRYWAIKTDAGVEDFLLLAETWAQIRELEEIAARESRAEQYRQAAEAWGIIPSSAPAGHLPTPHSVGKADISPRRGESSPEGKARAAKSVGPYEEDEGKTRAAAPHPPAVPAPSPQGEGIETVPVPVSDSDTQPEEKPETARKAADIQRLEELRAAGFTLQQIADAARGLTITEVTDALGRKKMSVTTWSKIEKAIDALTLRAAVEEGE